MKKRLLCVLLAGFIVVFLTSCGKTKEVAAAEKPEKPIVAEEVKTAEPTIKPKPSAAPITEERTLFGFERSDDGFEIPFWAEEKEDNAGTKVSLSKDVASEGNQSLCLAVDFPGKIWSSGLVELEQYLDLTPYREIAVDVYVPEDTPLGLKAKIILTVGEKWKFTEMARSVPLVPGEWITIRANLEPGTMDWKRTEVTDEFRADVRKIVVRVESNRRPVYSGPIYIDNIRVGK